jgi:hypothetical protein
VRHAELGSRVLEAAAAGSGFEGANRMLNGTSSVLYGTVPELVTAKRIERAFALFYTGTLGSSALAPVLYGRLGDAAGPVWAAVAAAVTALAVVPLMLLL